MGACRQRTHGSSGRGAATWEKIIPSLIVRSHASFLAAVSVGALLVLSCVIPDRTRRPPPRCLAWLRQLFVFEIALGFALYSTHGDATGSLKPYTETHLHASQSPQASTGVPLPPTAPSNASSGPPSTAPSSASPGLGVQSETTSHNPGTIMHIGTESERPVSTVTIMSMKRASWPWSTRTVT